VPVHAKFEPDPVNRCLPRLRLPVYLALMTQHVSPASSFASSLLEGLSSFRAEGVSGVAPHAAGLFSYCALTRERLKSVSLPRPIIGTVLSGAKEIWRGEMPERLATGTLFVLPAGIALDIVNEPDEKTGLYQSLIIEVEPDATPELGLLKPVVSGMPDSCVVPLAPALVEAMLHATRAIADGPAGAAVRMARLSELLALLHDVPAAQPLFDMSISERLSRLLRAGLDQDWTAARAAKTLGLSESTLRRRLAAEGGSFSTLLRLVRMEEARRLLAQGERSGVAALAVGYVSRTHFARAFRATFGDNPVRG